jgi:hypothetical protein
MSDNPFFTARQYESLCNGLPDPTLVFTESGRYAAVLGGKDQRYYHDATALVGQFIADVLAPAKALWFLQQIREALSSQRVQVVEYELSAADLLGLPWRACRDDLVRRSHQCPGGAVLGRTGRRLGGWQHHGQQAPAAAVAGADPDRRVDGAAQSPGLYARAGSGLRGPQAGPAGLSPEL